ncbi:MAG: carbohydrate ABC transporter permease [Lachnospiraceae bacterium]|nr:carbohydrate ABC transporter permease [Lachnospiraceae bacterium]
MSNVFAAAAEKWNKSRQASKDHKAQVENALKNKEIRLVDLSFIERNRMSQGYLLALKIKKVAIIVARFVLFFGLSFLILQPILSKISMSFMAEKDLYDSTVINIPAHFTLDNYRVVSELMAYGKCLGGSLFYSAFLAVLQVAVCTLVGYGFARFEFPFKKFWFFCVILTIIIPPQTISSALYLHFNYFDILGLIKLITGHTVNLRGSALPYILMSGFCMGLKNGVYIFMTRQYFRNVPRAMEEAAYVDGSGTLRTFVQVLLPDAKPIITSCFLFAFVWQWTDAYYSKLFLGNADLLSTSLSGLGDRFNQYMQREHGVIGVGTGYTSAIISTGTLMVIVPLIILYLFEQRGFTESLAGTSVKM